MNFVLNLFKFEYIAIGDDILKFPFDGNREELINKKGKYEERLIYYKKLDKLFEYFNVDFDLDIDKLSDDDYNNLNYLLNLFDGNFDSQIEHLHKYFVDIGKYRFLFVALRGKEKNEIINFYSSEILNRVYCSSFADETSKVENSIYSSINADDLLGVSNFRSDVILESYNNIDCKGIVCQTMNYAVLAFLKAYDISKNIEFLHTADELCKIICKDKSNEEIDFFIINSMQIRYRLNGKLDNQDKQLLYAIGKKEVNKDNYMLQCSINILIGNEFSSNQYYSKLNSEDKTLFDDYPISNLLNHKK